MLKVWYSNRLEALVEGLIKVDRAERLARAWSPLERTPVVVPGDTMSAYLRLGVARRAGIAARLDYSHIGHFFETLLPDDTPASLIKSQTLQFMIYRTLQDEAFMAAEALQHPREYLNAAEFEPDTLQLRRFQLSAHLTRLFDEYELNRPEMLQRWIEEDKSTPNAPTLASNTSPQTIKHQAWQRAIWLNIFGQSGLVSEYTKASGHRLVRLAEIIHEIPHTSWRAPEVVHFFGLDRLGRVFEPLLAALAEVADIHIWALNPCEEFWEDVLTDIDEEAHLLSSKPTKTDAAAQPNLFGPAPAEPFWEPERFPLPLRLWGRVGRDQIRMFNRLCAHDPQMLFVPADTAQPTLLAQIQRDVLKLQYERSHPIPRFEAAEEIDSSITILACPGVQREVEVVANEIWRLIKEDPSLGLNQIAILLNRDQASAYHTQIAAIFRDTYDLPFNIRDMEKSAAGGVFEAVELLLDLGYTELRRKDFLRLLTHPNVMARFKNIAPETWIRWCEELQIIHGEDHKAHQNTYITHDLFNWDQGLKRLTLGGFMTGAELSDDERIFEGPAFEYLPYEYSPDELEAASELVQLARDLMRATARCRHEKMTLRAWFEWSAALIAKNLSPSESADEDEDDLQLCRQTLADLARVDPWDNLEEALGDEPNDNAQLARALKDAPTHPIPFRVAREFIRRAIATLEGHAGQYLIDGVTVSTLTPARPLPFKHIFCLGMGEAHFPSADPVDPLDLRREKWQEGDASRRDQDKYALLQALMAAEERVYLSYIARDSATGEALQPSSAIQDLLRMLEQQYLGPQKTRQLIQKHPLRRFDGAYFPELRAPNDDNPLQPNYHPEARREAAAHALKASLADHLEQSAGDGENFAQLPELPTLLAKLNPKAAPIVSKTLGGYSLTDAPPRVLNPNETLDLSISLTQLRQFLESPLQAGARFNLGMRADEQEDPFAVDDERFEPAYAESVGLLRDVFARAMAPIERASASTDEPAAQSLVAQTYDERAKFLELKGILPTGVFFEQARRQHLAILDAWRANLARLHPDGAQALRLLHFGRASRRAPADLMINSITLNTALKLSPDAPPRPLRVELYGTSELLDLNATTAATLVTRKSIKNKDFLRGFFTHIALAAAGKADPSAPFSALVLPISSLGKPKSFSKYRRTFKPITQAEAVDYLSELIRDLLSGPHPHAMPIEAVFDYFNPKNEASFAELVEKSFANSWSSNSAEFGPLRQPARFGLPDNAEATIQRRFGPFFSALLDEAAGE